MNHQTQLPAAIADAVPFKETFEKVQFEAKHAMRNTEHYMSKHPFRSVGAALGTGVVAGVALGAVGHALFSRKPPTLLQRFGSIALVGSALQGLTSLLRR